MPIPAGPGSGSSSTADMLATPEDFSALLQSDLDRATTELLLQCSTAVVQAVTGQRIVQVVDDSVTFYLDQLDCGEYLPLPQHPVTAISSVLLGATAVSDYTPDYGRGRLYRLLGWRSTASLYSTGGVAPVSVTYTHGYAPGDQKLQLARAATLSLAVGAYTNPSGAVREAIDDYSVQYAEMSAGMQASPFLIAALKKQYSPGSGTSVRLVRS